MNKREIENAIREEVAEWEGVTLEFVAGGKHPKAKLTFGDQTLFRAFGGNQSATAYPHKTIADMRDTMAQLGASRKAEPPSKEDSEKRYRERNEEGVNARPDPVKREPVKPKPDIADQLVDAGLVSADDRASIQAEGSAATYANAGAAKSLFERMSDAQRDDDPEDDEEAQRIREKQEFDAAVAAVQDGIHFDLDEKIYHAVPALGSSALVELIVGPPQFWRGSWLDPERPEFDEDSTAAQIIGKAYHCALFEPDAMDARFARKPSIDDYPKRGLVRNGTEVGNALADLGCTKTMKGENVADQAQRLEDEGYEGTIWPLVEARFKRQLGSRTPLGGDVWDRIAIDVQRAHENPDIAPLVTGGASEVAVIWTDQHGIRCKAKLDKLTAEHWADLKTFENPRRKRTHQAIVDAIQYDRIYVQAVHYRDAVEAIRLGNLQIVGNATDDQRAMIAAIQIRPEELPCWYVFQQKRGVPNLYGYRFKFHSIDPRREYDARALVKEERQEATLRTLREATRIHKLGRIEIDKAKRDFVLYSQTYPVGEPWAPIECLGTIGDEDFSEYLLSGL